MFTTRGYRQHSKENRKKSQSGQIIQKRPVFQIDNNPVVLQAYKDFILSTMPRLLKTELGQDTHEITLADFSLTWDYSVSLDDIESILITFASNIFDQYKANGKFPVSLVLYHPYSSENYVWSIMSNYLYSSSIPLYENFNEIIIDTAGNVSYTKFGNISYCGATTPAYMTQSNCTLGIDDITTTAGPSWGSPTTMKMTVKYFTFYNSN